MEAFHSIISIVTLCICTTIMLFVVHKKENNKDDLSDLLSYCISQEYFSAITSNQQIENQSFIEYYEKKYAPGTPLLIVYTPSFSCESCLRSIVSTLKESLQIDDSSKVLFVFQGNQRIPDGIPNNAINMIEGFDLDIENLQLPFAFVYDGKFIQHTYIPDSRTNQAFLAWIEGIKQHYFDN